MLLNIFKRREDCKKNMQNNLYNFTINLTTRCNVKCVACLKSTSKYMYLNEDFDVTNFKNIFNLNVLLKIKSISFLGNIGDFTLYPYLSDVLEYIAECNPNITIISGTNGMLCNDTWSKKFIPIFEKFKRYKIIFAIDGMEENHEKYRIGSNFNTIFKNVITFKKLGGRCNVQFIEMEHNKSDFLKLQMRLRLFNINTIIKKPWKSKTNTFYDANNKKAIERLKKAPLKTKITDCPWFTTNRFYISHNYIFMPCCHFTLNKTKNIPSLFPKTNLLYNNLQDLLKDDMFLKEYYSYFLTTECLEKECL